MPAVSCQAVLMMSLCGLKAAVGPGHISRDRHGSGTPEVLQSCLTVLQALAQKLPMKVGAAEGVGGQGGGAGPSSA